MDPTLESALGANDNLGCLTGGAGNAQQVDILILTLSPLNQVDADLVRSIVRGVRPRKSWGAWAINADHQGNGLYNKDGLSELQLAQRVDPAVALKFFQPKKIVLFNDNFSKDSFYNQKIMDELPDPSLFDTAVVLPWPSLRRPKYLECKEHKTIPDYNCRTCKTHNAKWHEVCETREQWFEERLLRAFDENTPEPKRVDGEEHLNLKEVDSKPKTVKAKTAETKDKKRQTELTGFFTSNKRQRT